MKVEAVLSLESVSSLEAASSSEASLVVDAHQHLWDLKLTPQPWIDGSMGPINRSFLAPDLAVTTGSLVDQTVVVQTVNSSAETRLLCGYAQESDLIGAVVGWVDLTAADVGEFLAELKAAPGGDWLRGIRHQVQAEPDDQWLCRPDVWRGLEVVGRHGLVYELLTLPHQLPAAIATAQALPEVAFVLNHLSKPSIAAGTIEPWATQVRQLAKLENVTCKLSGMVTEADWASWRIEDLRPFVDVVLDAFGADRLMFGSDWPVCLLAAEYEEVFDVVQQLTGDLSQSERNSVFGLTAARVYGLN